MVTKQTKSTLLFVPVLCATAAATPLLTSCSLFLSDKAQASSLQKYMNPSSQIRWISERTMSLRFSNEGKTGYPVGYGTGWIMGRNRNKHSTYYVATNMHVASFLMNQGKQFYEKQGSGYHKGNPSPWYPTIDIGIVGTKNLDNTFDIGTDQSLRKHSDGGIHFVSRIKTTTSAKVVFSGYQTYESMVSLPDDPYKVRDDKIINGALDLAIIEMDFSNFSPLSGYNRNIMNNFLTNYDKNPTKFAKDPGENFTNLYVGGFPFQNPELNPPNPFTGNPSNPIWVGLSNITLSSKTTGYSLPISAPSNLRKPYYDTAIQNEIKYNAKSLGSFRNIALQGLMDGVDMGGGSSGSMVVNSNNEVVGIYWGTYTLTNSSGKKNVVGGFDYLYSNKSYRVKAANGVTAICSSYNAIQAMERVIGKNNFDKPIWS